MAASFVHQILDGCKNDLSVPAIMNHIVFPSTSQTNGSSKIGDAILQSCLSHVLAIPTRSAKLHLLQVLNQVDSPMKIKMLSPLLQSLTTLLKTSGLQETVISESLKIVTCIIQTYTVSASRFLFESKGKTYFKDFLALFQLDGTPAHNKIAIAALNQLSNSWLQGVPDKNQNLLLSSLMSAAISGNHIITKKVKSILQNITIKVDFFITEIKSTLEKLSLDDEKRKEQEGDDDEDDEIISNVAKKVKLDTDTNSDAVVNVQDRLIFVLEILQTQTSLLHADKLISTLFLVLAMSSNTHHTLTTKSFEYIKQLATSALLNIFESVEVMIIASPSFPDSFFFSPPFLFYY